GHGDARGRLAQPRREPAALLDDLVRGLPHDDRAQSHRPAGVRASTEGRLIAVTGDQPDLLEVDTKPLHDELREARLVTLARGQRAEHDVHDTVGAHRDLRPLARHSGVELDVVGEADATVPAALARLDPSLLEAVPVGP